jgi:hypothetical protein
MIDTLPRCFGRGSKKEEMMSKKRNKQLVYSGMQRSSGQSVQSKPLVVERAPGRPDLFKIDVNFAMAAPELAMYADYVHVKRVRDGVEILFGKVHPFDSTRVEQAIDISFPYRPFVTQLVKSAESERGGGHRPFKESVQEAIARFGYNKIEKLEEPREMKSFSAFRSNFVYMALHEDDAAIDFYHLDAATMQMAQAAAATTGRGSAGIKGVIRVVVSPTLLLYFLKLASTIAEELIRTVPSIEESPMVGETP